MKSIKNISMQGKNCASKGLQECSKIKTPDWTIKDVKSVLSSLKARKSKDSYDLPNEIFKPEVTGDDLIIAVTKVMNIIKNELSYPTLLELCSVTNLYKQKGDRPSFNSYRGIFSIKQYPRQAYSQG